MHSTVELFLVQFDTFLHGFSKRRSIVTCCVVFAVLLEKIWHLIQTKSIVLKTLQIQKGPSVDSRLLNTEKITKGAIKSQLIP